MNSRRRTPPKPRRRNVEQARDRRNPEGGVRHSQAAPETRHPEASLRVGIRGGGCSGFTYVIEFHDGPPRARDIVLDVKRSRGGRARRGRPEEPPLPQRQRPRVGADADHAGLQVPEPATRRPGAAAVTRSPCSRTGCSARHDESVRHPRPRSHLFELDLRAAEKTHRELSRALHPDRYVGTGASERRASARAGRRSSTRRGASCAIRSGAPRRCSRSPASRWATADEPEPAPSSLMEMMEQREALAEARGQARTSTAYAASWRR